MAKARLTDGSIVRLERDCECVTHRNPHWLHMDNFRRAQNEKAVEPIRTGNAFDAFHATALMNWFAEAELARLREKRQNMERRGIAELIHEPDDEIPVRRPGRKTRRRKSEPEMIFTGDRVLLTDPLTGKPIGS